MLRQVEWGVENGSITKNEFCPVTTLFFCKFCFRLTTSYKKFDVPTTQMSILILFVITGVSFE